MPSNEIMSVEGQLCGMPLAGPESFSQQQLDYLKQALGVDETVLYESENGITGASFPITLSENPNNFERIRIVFRPWTSGKTAMEFPGDETTFTLSTNWSNAGITSIYNFMTVFSSSGTSLSFVANKFIQWGATTINTDNTQFRLFKVVGIKRIAGGN